MGRERRRGDGTGKRNGRPRRASGSAAAGGPSFICPLPARTSPLAPSIVHFSMQRALEHSAAGFSTNSTIFVISIVDWSSERVREKRARMGPSRGAGHSRRSCVPQDGRRQPRELAPVRPIVRPAARFRSGRRTYTYTGYTAAPSRALHNCSSSRLSVSPRAAATARKLFIFTVRTHSDSAIGDRQFFRPRSHCAPPRILCELLIAHQLITRSASPLQQSDRQ